MTINFFFVEVKPEFTKKLSDMKVKEKEKATLSCEMNKENVKVIWKKNGQELKSDNRVKIVADSKVHQLIIENVTIEDKAEYSCVAAGDVSTTANIIVEGTLIFSFAFFLDIQISIYNFYIVAYWFNACKALVVNCIGYLFVGLKFLKVNKNCAGNDAYIFLIPIWQKT